jgi:hypothetical protein
VIAHLQKQQRAIQQVPQALENENQGLKKLLIDMQAKYQRLLQIFREQQNDNIGRSVLGRKKGVIVEGRVKQ